MQVTLKKHDSLGEKLMTIHECKKNALEFCKKKGEKLKTNSIP